MKFRLLKKDATTAARRGVMEFSRGTVQTPVFMPVATRGAMRSISMTEIDRMGFEIFLANTYHLYLKPGTELLTQTGGLHNFMNFHRPLLTDSGGFQVFSLSDLCKVKENGVEFRSHLDGSKHFFTPEMVLNVQRVIGSDIMMVLDQCVEYPAEKKRVRQAMDRTLKWAQEARDYYGREFDTEAQALFAIVQGGVHHDLRLECADRMIQMDFPGYAIGGLSVGEPKEMYREMSQLVGEVLPEHKPRYMMGVGSPMEILDSIAHGIDMFDCVMPTRIARNGTLYTSLGRMNLKNSAYERDFSPLDPNCSCPACTRYTRAYLRHIFKMQELTAMVYLTIHNMQFMRDFIVDIQTALDEDRFPACYAKWKALYGPDAEKIVQTKRK